MELEQKYENYHIVNLTDSELDQMTPEMQKKLAQQVQMMMLKKILQYQSNLQMKNLIQKQLKKMPEMKPMSMWERMKKSPLIPENNQKIIVTLKSRINNTK